jgi:predicted ATPase
MVSEVALVERVRATTHNREAWANNLEALVDNRKVEQEVPDIQQADLFEQFTKVLLALAHQHPLILFIDDLQWADVGSIGLLFHLGRRLAGSRILVVGAYRPEEVSLGRAGERHPLEQVVLQFQRDFDEVPIDLDQSQGRNFVEAVLESEPNALDKTFRETLFHKTTGHPLFTIELLRSVQECGDLIQDEDGRWVETSTLSWNKLPARVEAVIAERIGRLPQNLRRILEVASVEGEEFTAEVVAEVLDVDEGLIVQQLSEQLGRKHHLVAATRAKHLNGRRILRYRFQHHLFQVFLYGTLDNVERVYFHELVGATLERFFQEQPEEIKTILVKLAWHFQEAGNPEKAIHYLRRSGEKAERLSASEEAITHYRNALAVSVKLPETLERDQIELGLIMALGAQLIATRGFSSVEVEQIYMRAQRLCQKLSECLGDAQRAASQLIPVLLGLGAFYGHQAQFQASQEIYDQIFVLARAAQDPEALMMANWGPGYLLVHMGEFSLARSYLERALEAYDPHKHQWMVTVFTLDMGVSCLSWLSWALFFLGYPDQALQRSREAIALARQISHPFSLAVALAVASGLQCSALDAQGTRQLAEEAIEICRQKGFNFWLGVAGTFRGLALAGQGKYNEGIAQMREGERVWRASGATIGFSEYYIDLAEVFGNAGQVEEGLGVLEEVLETINKSGERMYVAELFRIKGDLLLKQSHENQAKAEACYRRAIEAARSQQAKILELRATSSLSRLLLKQGGRDEARELLNNIYSWFTEGWNAADLQTAYNFLQELS